MSNSSQSRSLKFVDPKIETILTVLIAIFKVNIGLDGDQFDTCCRGHLFKRIDHIIERFGFFHFKAIGNQTIFD